MNHAMWIDKEQTVMFTVWANGEATVAFRDTPDDVWGPPLDLRPVEHNQPLTLEEVRLMFAAKDAVRP